MSCFDLNNGYQFFNRLAKWKWAKGRIWWKKSRVSGSLASVVLHKRAVAAGMRWELAGFFAVIVRIFYVEHLTVAEQTENQVAASVSFKVLLQGARKSTKIRAKCWQKSMEVIPRPVPDFRKDVFYLSAWVSGFCFLHWQPPLSFSSLTKTKKEQELRLKSTSSREEDYWKSRGEREECIVLFSPLNFFVSLLLPSPPDEDFDLES